MTKYEVLYQFWSGFGVPAYEESSVPPNAQMPYITFQAQIGDFNDTIGLTASIWTRSTSWLPAIDIESRISRKIVNGFYDGNIFVTKGVPFAIPATDDSDDMIRRKVLNIFAEFPKKEV